MLNQPREELEEIMSQTEDLFSQVYEIPRRRSSSNGRPLAI